MNRRTTVFLILFILLVGGGALLVGLIQGKAVSQACSHRSVIHYRVTISHDKASLTRVSGHLCDTLTFINQDDITREIAFGPHENHVPYDGVAEKFLNRGQSFTVTFDEVGSFRWHDHIHDEVQGNFTVSK